MAFVPAEDGFEPRQVDQVQIFATLEQAVEPLAASGRGEVEAGARNRGYRDVLF